MDALSISQLVNEVTDKTGKDSWNLIIEQPNLSGDPSTYKMRLDTLLSGSLIPSGGEVDLDNNSLVNVNGIECATIECSGLPDILPYIQSNTNLSTGTVGAADFTFQPFNAAIGNFDYKNLVLRKEAGKLDINSIQFPRSGFYVLSIDYQNTANYSSDPSGSLESNVRTEIYTYVASPEDYTLKAVRYQKGTSKITTSYDSSNNRYRNWDQLLLAIYIDDPEKDRLEVKFDSYTTGAAATSREANVNIAIYAQR